MKFYRIQGESGWYSWEDLHNLYGYTETPSLSLQYKSAASETWGEYAASGYSDNAFEDLAACSYFVSGEPGWGGLNGLATVLHLYPAVCSDGPNVTNGVVTSPTATYDFNGETFYLIRNDVAHGWIAGADLSSYGWEIEDDTQYELLFFDTTTSKVTYGVESVNEFAFVEAGYFTIDDGADVVFVKQSQFPIVCTYTESIASQSIAPDAGFATGLPYYDSKLYAVQTSDGVNVTRSGWEAGEEPVDPGYIDVLLGLKYQNDDWIAVDVSNDYYWAGILNSSDQSRLSALGLVESGSSYPYKELFYRLENDYTFIALYSDIGETVISTTPSDFSVAGRSAHGGNVATIVCTGSYGTLAKTWKCRIAARTLYKLYLKADQTEQYMYEYTWYTLYDEDGNQATSVPDTYNDPSMRQYFIGYYLVDQTEIENSIISAFDFIMQNGVPKVRADRNYANMIGFVFSSLNP